MNWREIGGFDITKKRPEFVFNEIKCSWITYVEPELQLEVDIVNNTVYWMIRWRHDKETLSVLLGLWEESNGHRRIIQTTKGQ